MKFNLQTAMKMFVIIMCVLIVLYVAWLIVAFQDSSKETDEQAALQSCLFAAQNTYSKDRCYLIHPQIYYPDEFWKKL